MMERIPWLNVRPYIAQRIDLREPAPPAIAPAARALFTTPFRDAGDAPCAACGQDWDWRTRRKVSAAGEPYAFLMLCDDVRACNAATAAVA